MNHSNTEFTPSQEHSLGPWKAMPDKGNPKRFQVRGPEDGNPTARFVCENARMANARLIAAAPELLDALRGLADWCREHTSPLQPNTPHSLLVKAIEAIGRAEGRG